MMENFPNLRREKVTQIQETQRVPSKRNPKRPTARHIIITMAKFQDKERILKAAKEETGSNIKGSPNKVSKVLNENAPSQKRMAKNTPSNENQRPAAKATLPSKALNPDRTLNKELPRQKKSKRIHLHQTSSARDSEGTALRKRRKRERESNTGMKKWQ